MKDAIGMVVGIVITIVSLVSFLDNTFVPYRKQQAFMAQSNESMLSSLRAELGSTNGVNLEMDFTTARDMAKTDLEDAKSVSVGGINMANSAAIDGAMVSGTYRRVYNTSTGVVNYTKVS